MKRNATSSSKWSLRCATIPVRWDDKNRNRNKPNLGSIQSFFRENYFPDIIHMIFCSLLSQIYRIALHTFSRLSHFLSPHVLYKQVVPSTCLSTALIMLPRYRNDNWSTWFWFTGGVAQAQFESEFWLSVDFAHVCALSIEDAEARWAFRGLVMYKLQVSSN